MKNKSSIVLLLLLSLSFYSQKKTFKCEKIYDAVKLIDDQKYAEAITILRECEKIDPKEYTYPYEIALSYTNNKEYEKAISELKKIKNYNNISANYYQLLGNNFDYIGKSKEAISTYDEGLKKFPNAGRLYLEKGVMYETDNPLEATKFYEKGIEVDPMYASNYYRAAKIYLKTNDRLTGLIYGEIFMNIERTTKRTQEMSELLYNGYKNSMTFVSKNEKRTDFCPAVIDIDKYKKDKMLPLCSNFALAFTISMAEFDEFNYINLMQIRKKFISEYLNLNKKVTNTPNVLLNYFKTMEDNKVFNAYNYYIFQVPNKENFTEWQTKNEDEYNRFTDWYTTTSNNIAIDSKNVYISDQIK